MARGLITWTTDIAASSQVEYGPTSSYGSLSTYDARRVTSHSVQLVGLTPGATYHYRVLSRNTAGTLTTGVDNTFTYSTGYLATVLQDTPLAYWRLDEPSGTVATDLTGNGYTGTYTGGFSLNATGALANDTDKAVTFNGTTGYVQVPYVPTFAHLPFTVEAWVQASSWPVGDMPVFTCGDANTTDDHLVLTIRNGSPVLAFWNDDFTPTSALSTGVYHHLVFVWEGTGTKTQRIYVDGAQVGAGRTSGADLAVSTGAITGAGGLIGQSVYNTAFWSGQLDEVAIYGTALSATRVLAHYNASLAVSPVLTAISPTSLLVGSGPVTVTFTGTNTSWLSVSVPTITVSSGSLGTVTATADTTAHATFTPPLVASTVTFTDTTDGNTTATITVSNVKTLTSISPTTLIVGGGAVTVTFTGTGTTWQSVGVPTITVSAGSLGAITATNDTTAHAVFTPPGTPQNVTFTDTTDGSSTVVLSITTPIVTPTQVPGMPPALVVEVAFSTNPSDPPQWVDITRYVQGTLGINRGRQRELDQIQAGTLAIELDNRDRRFDPTFTGSPYYPNVIPMRRIRARATYNNSNFALFTGYVQSWGQQWAGWQDATVPVTASDAFLPLNLAQLNTSFPSETSDQRVNDVLSAINWTIGGPAWTLGVSALGSTTVVGPTGDRVISPGSSTIQPSTLANVAALQHLQDVTATEMGFLFTDRDGALTFFGRNRIINKTSLATFGEASGELPYVDATMLYDDTQIWNDIELTRVGGIQQSAQDTASQAQYYLRTLSNTSMLQDTDNEALSLATALLGKYAQPTLQISSLTLDGWANPAMTFPQMLGREIGDLVTVRRRPPGGGPVLEQPSIIQGIAISYAVEGGDWTTTWQLAPADTLNYWTLNDPVLSVLGNGSIPGSGTTRLFF